MATLVPLLAFILLGGRVAAAVAQRRGMPPLLGELVFGLALGPLLVGPSLRAGVEFVSALGQVGVLILMFLVGLETDLSVIKGVGKAATLTAAGGACGAIALITGVGTLLGFPLHVALFIGVALSATSVSVSAAALRQLGAFDSPAGRTIVVAAIIDDVIGVVMIAAVGRGQDASIAVAGVRIVGFLLLVVLGGALLPRLAPWLERQDEHLLALAVGLGLLYAWAAAQLGGLAGVTGAYAAGVLLARALPHRPFLGGIDALVTGFFATIFFVSLGLHVQLTTVSPALALLLAALVILAKVAGAGGGARLAGLPRREARIVGSGMAPLGEVALIVATLGAQTGVLSPALFATLVVAILTTALVAPVLLQLACARPVLALPGLSVDAAWLREGSEG